MAKASGWRQEISDVEERGFSDASKAIFFKGEAVPKESRFR